MVARKACSLCDDTCSRDWHGHALLSDSRRQAPGVRWSHHKNGSPDLQENTMKTPFTYTNGTQQSAPPEVADHAGWAWLWVVVAILTIGLVGYVGGNMLGVGISQGSHVRAEFDQGLSGEPPLRGAMDQHAQSRELVGKGTATGMGGSGSSYLAEAAARSRIIIDEEGIVHEVGPDGNIIDPLDVGMDPELQTELNALDEQIRRDMMAQERAQPERPLPPLNPPMDIAAMDAAPIAVVSERPQMVRSSHDAAQSDIFFGN